MVDVTVYFEGRLHALIIKKRKATGAPLSQKEIAKATGLSEALINRWLNKPMARIDARTVSVLVRYFGCKSSDLYVVIERDKELS